MHIQSNSKSSLSWRRYGAVAVAGVVILSAFYYWQSRSEQAAPSPTQAQAEIAASGPGVLTGSDMERSLSKQEEEMRSPVPGGLSVTADRQLTINHALLQVIDFFLLEQTSPDRAGALQNYLKKSLPGPAYDAAIQIVERYQLYMGAHDDFLARQDLGEPYIAIRSRNIYRLLTWREQRDRIRLSILGEPVVQAWYRDDDAQLNQVLDELRQRTTSVSASGQEVPGRAIDTTIADGEQHEQDMQLVLDKATKSFGTLALEAQQWNAHFATFVVASQQINQQTRLRSFERARQIQELLVKTFPTEAERQRARDLAP